MWHVHIQTNIVHVQWILCVQGIGGENTVDLHAIKENGGWQELYYYVSDVLICGRIYQYNRIIHLNFFLLFRLWPQPVGRLESPRVRSVSGTFNNKCVGRSSVTMNITLYALISPGMIDSLSLLVSSLKFSIIF